MPGDLRNNAWFAPKPAPDPIDDLANAIILRAVDDYVMALKLLRKHPDAVMAGKEKRSIEHFFASSWCKILTSVDMVSVAKIIRKRIADGELVKCLDDDGTKKEDTGNGNQET